MYQGDGSQGARNRVNRGGSFNDTAANGRSANRNRNTPDDRDNDLGCRPANASRGQTAGVHGRPRRAR